MVDSAYSETDVGSSSTADVARHRAEMLKHKQRGGAVAGRQRSSWAGLSSFEEPMKQGTEKHAHFAPILVSCSGSDEGESSSDQQGQLDGLLQQRNSVASTLDGAESSSSSSTSSNSDPVPAKIVSQADVQAGCFKTGVRYSLETRPNSLILQVGVCSSGVAKVLVALVKHTSLMVSVACDTVWPLCFWPARTCGIASQLQHVELGCLGTVQLKRSQGVGMAVSDDYDFYSKQGIL